MKNMHRIPHNSYLMIIGAMKSGTSTLYWYLSQHRNICPCIIKEPEFFSEKQAHGIKVEDYSELWRFDHNQHNYVLEASTGYTKYPYETNVAKNIKSYGISPTFLYIVRNPLERIESHYNWSIHRKWFNPSTKIIDERFVHYSNYFRQLETYRKYFGSKKIIILDFDLMIRTPNYFLQLLFDRLKLSSEGYEFDNIAINKTKSLTQAEVLFHKHPFLKFTKNLLPQSLKRLLKKIYKEPFYRTSNKRKFTDKERNIIRDKLKSDMALFGSYYNFPVNKWGF